MICHGGRGRRHGAVGVGAGWGEAEAGQCCVYKLYFYLIYILCRGKFPFTVSHCELVYQIRAVVVSMCIVGTEDTFQVGGAGTWNFLIKDT